MRSPQIDFYQIGNSAPNNLTSDFQYTGAWNNGNLDYFTELDELLELNFSRTEGKLQKIKIILFCIQN
jgi:hypothetical protein